MASTCPNCQRVAVTVAHAANDSTLSESIRAKLALPASPARRTSGGLGCVTLALSFGVASLISVIVGGIAEITNGMNFPAQGMRFGETGVFSGIATFIVVMVAMFSFFVWRQARIDAHYTYQFGIWHQQKTAFERDLYCPHCDTRWTPTTDEPTT